MNSDMESLSNRRYSRQHSIGHQNEFIPFVKERSGMGRLLSLKEAEKRKHRSKESQKFLLSQ